MTETLLLYNLKLNFLIFFYQSKQLTDYIYTDTYCKLSKCIGQTTCSYEHYLNTKYSCRFRSIKTLTYGSRVFRYAGSCTVLETLFRTFVNASYTFCLYPNTPTKTFLFLVLLATERVLSYFNQFAI